MAYTTLISVDELKQCINDDNVRIIDCRFNLGNTSAGHEAWQQGHIAGAVYAHLDNDLSGEKTDLNGRHPLPGREKIAGQLGKWGVNSSTQVIAYDAMGGAMASRLWWLCRWLGHENVAVLDGGFPAWEAAGGEINAEQPVYAEGDFVAAEALSEDVDVAKLQDMLAQGDITLVDARDPGRFRGEGDNMDAVAGHVPGAVNHFFMQNLDENGRFKTADALRQSFARLTDACPAANIVHMCGSGVTACHNLLAMKHAGIDGPKIYIGSWSEWIRDPARPVATGE